MTPRSGRRRWQRGNRTSTAFYEFVEHYNSARPHLGINLDAPIPLHSSSTIGPNERVDRLGGLIHEYHRAA